MCPNRTVRRPFIVLGRRSHFLSGLQLYRVCASDATREVGFFRIYIVRRGRQPRDYLVPIARDLNMVVRSCDQGVTVSVSPREVTIEALGIYSGALGLLRRYFSSLRVAVLKFGGVEIFPEGKKATTRSFRKQLTFARHSRLAFDSPFVIAHPELLEGFSVKSEGTEDIGGRSGTKIAVALHLHYAALWSEIETLLRGWRLPFTLFVTLTDANDKLANQIRSAFPDAQVRVSENRGRDVRPFLALLEEGAFDSFGLVCKIHGKRSLGNDRLPIFGDVLRRLTFRDLIGDSRQVEAVVGRFDADATLGLIGSDRFLSASRPDAPSDVVGPANRENVDRLAARIGVPIRDDDLDYFSGTMFWVRPQALEPLRRLGLAANSFEPESNGFDGMLEHAVERLFNHAVRVSGLRVEGTTAPDCVLVRNDPLAPCEQGHSKTASVPKHGRGPFGV